MDEQTELRYSRWRHLLKISMSNQKRIHWFLKQKIVLFHSLHIWIAKTTFLIVNIDVSYIHKEMRIL